MVMRPILIVPTKILISFPCPADGFYAKMCIRDSADAGPHHRLAVAERPDDLTRFRAGLIPQVDLIPRSYRFIDRLKGQSACLARLRAGRCILPRAACPVFPGAIGRLAVRWLFGLRRFLRIQIRRQKAVHRIQPLPVINDPVPAV